MAILIIDNYDSFTFNLYQLVAEISDQEVIVRRNDELSLSEIIALSPCHLLLSPGPGHPKNPRDFGVCKDVVEKARAIACPILGVCLGHQGIVQHSGGNVVRAKQACHGKMSRIRINAPSLLFEGIESGSKVMRYHSLAADRASLPKNLHISAELLDDPDTVMAVEDRENGLFGVQFHPESVGTAAGKRLLQNFLRLSASKGA